MKSIEQLITIAKGAREKAYVPYSNYSVGAALLAKDGTVYEGANVEIVNGTSNCAERTAIFYAVSQGQREFEKIVVVTEDGSGTPCGFCRQTMVEFCDNDFKVIVSDVEGNFQEFKLCELLPNAFCPSSLKAKNRR